ncbi:GNAT family N-acetyltransferase [Hymenobacter koreensis]|uniref:N-acetyltransferase domain-containing protein n=1 Tax=Hymenobacter koreensis TaxID=1084523 RepID=A0ABP8IYL9_9BACT
MAILYREAQLSDIPELEIIRGAVTENVLSNPALVTTADYVEYLTRRGKGWVATTANGAVVGFAIADLLEHNIWALFLLPEYAAQGIGKRLHALMLDWYFMQTTHPVWLSTDSGTRAETFYRRQGWRETGRTGSGEVRFEMTVEEWNIYRSNILV